MKPTKRLNVYTESYDEIMSWARKMQDAGLIRRPINGNYGFAYYLAEYIKHYKK